MDYTNNDELKTYVFTLRLTDNDNEGITYKITNVEVLNSFGGPYFDYPYTLENASPNQVPFSWYGQDPKNEIPEEKDIPNACPKGHVTGIKETGCGKYFCFICAAKWTR